jgi:hypothetical protein
LSSHSGIGEVAEDIEHGKAHPVNHRCDLFGPFIICHLTWNE